MSILLDPRTHDPLIGKDGSLTLLETKEAIALQSFRVWANTGLGTDPIYPTFGINIENLLRAEHTRQFGIKKAIEVELINMMEQLPGKFVGFSLETTSLSNHVLTIRVQLKISGVQSPVFTSLVVTK
jgi:hypothetical protein